MVLNGLVHMRGIGASQMRNSNESPSLLSVAEPQAPGYDYRRAITIDHTKVPSTDQSNFPVLISGTYSYLATTANGGNVQNANGYDVIFSSDSGCSTKLDHEVETYNSTTGAVNYWVRVPSLSHTTNTVFYLCYGNSSISTSQENKTGVWDGNFKGVYHLKDGASLNVSDSTTNHNLTNNGATANGGEVDGAGSFDGSTQYLTIAQHTDFNWANLRTLDLWMKLGNTTQTLPRVFSHSDGNSDGWSLTWLDPTSGAGAGWVGNFLVVSIGTQGTPAIQRQTPDNGTINSTSLWHHVAVVGDGTSVASVYIDGNAVTLSNYPANITNTNIAGLDIGRRNNNGRYFSGSLDEIRFSNIQRSADWIKTEFNNQSSPSSFYRICPTVNDCNQPPVANAGGPYSGVSQIAVQLNGSGSSDPDGTISNYAWTFGDGTTGSGMNPSHVYELPGTYTVSLTVTDNSGATASASTTAVATNMPPNANVGGPYSGVAQQSIQFNGSASNDPDGTIASYQWNFSDGTGSGIAPAHTYQSPGSYYVTLTVTDNQGASSISGRFVTVTTTSNKTPIPNLGGPYSPVAGTPIQFNGSASSDPDGTITQYQWNFADGTATGPTPNHTFVDRGSHLVTLTVTDNGGATASKSLNVNVANSSGGLQIEADPNDVSWGPGNRDSLDNPLNKTGKAPNTTTGNSNFQIVAPVLSLAGRGIDLKLNLTYNSLVWNKSGSEMLFDIDHDSPAPGWQLGFGKMVGMGNAGALLIEPDGTRHPFTGSVFDYVYTNVNPNAHVQTFKGQTTDGSLIEYRFENGSAPEGVARYPNGTVVYYGNYTTDFSHPHQYAYPYTIVDANGNAVSIKYVAPWNDPEPRIERIIDSVGRVISFHYDSFKHLTSITGPGLPDSNGNPTIQTFVRIHYATKSLDLSGAFSGLNLRVQNSSTTFSAIDAIYYPTTGKGYWFGASDSYSTYGMITKVTEERGMSFTAGQTSDDQGTISEGTVTKQQIYDYPATAAGLTAAPAFSHLAESWSGGPSTAPQTTFALVDNPSASERTMTITNPDGTQLIQKSFNLFSLSTTDPNKFKDGLIKEQQTLDSAGHLLLKTIFTWESGADNAARLQRTDATDENNQVLSTVYDQYGTNNSIGRTRDYDYDGSTVIRTHINTYLSYLDNDLNQGISTQVGARIIHPRRVNLVDTGKVFAGDDSANLLAAETVYKYDEYAQTLQAYASDCDGNLDLFAFGQYQHNNGVAVGIVQHAANFNPLPPSCNGGSGSA